MGMKNFVKCFAVLAFASALTACKKDNVGNGNGTVDPEVDIATGGYLFAVQKDDGKFAPATVYVDMMDLEQQDVYIVQEKHPGVYSKAEYVALQYNVKKPADENVARVSLLRYGSAPVLCFEGLAPGKTEFSIEVSPKDDEKTILLSRTFQIEVYKSDKYVDLGLSVLWATRNVGALSRSDFGYYFAWGETAPKQTFDLSNYTLWGKDGMTKYNEADGKIYLEEADDAAAKNMGRPWRMPTYEEWDELIALPHEIHVINGNYGCLFTAPNGKTIFFPCAGYKTNGGFHKENEWGMYWRNVLIGNGTYQNAHNVILRKDGSIDFGAFPSRYSGYSVRGVRPKKK